MISCIIPAHNEAPRINGVLSAVIGHPGIDEIIVINDASTDGTEEVLKKHKSIDIISLSHNRGKTHALMLGFQRAKHDTILMIDSDLVGLTKDAITALIEPVISGRADVSITLRKNSLLIFKILGMDFISGERVFSRRILGDLETLESLTGFAFESYFNQIMVRDKLRIASVYWRNVISPRKRAKFGYWDGQKRDFKMIVEIIHLLSIRGLIRMCKGMLALRVA